MVMERILVVDDELPIAEVVGEILSDAGYTVQLAHYGQAALAIVATWQPHLVISDVMMPRMGGAELSRQLALRTDTPVRVILMSAGGTHLLPPPTTYHAFLPKPFLVEQVVDLVAAVLTAESPADLRVPPAAEG